MTEATTRHFVLSKADSARHKGLLSLLFRTRDVECFAVDDGDALIEATDGESTIGVTWAKSQGGGIAEIVRPVVTVPTDSVVEAELVSYAVEDLSARGHHLIQSCLDESDNAGYELFKNCGFSFAGESVMMAAKASASLQSEAGRLSIDRYNDHRHDDLVAVLTQAFEDSSDFPSLSGTQSPEQAIDQFERIGDSGRENWYLASRDGTPVGCLLAAEHRRDRLCELVFVGLAAAFRGKGLGAELVLKAKTLACEMGCKRIFLGVDASNLAAMKTYLATGFNEIQRRTVMIREQQTTNAIAGVSTSSH